MVLYPVHRLIFKIVFKKIGRVVLRPDLLFPSPCIIQSGASKVQTGRMMPDAGRGCFGPKLSSGQRRREHRVSTILVVNWNFKLLVVCFLG